MPEPLRLGLCFISFFKPNLLKAYLKFAVAVHYFAYPIVYKSCVGPTLHCCNNVMCHVTGDLGDSEKMMGMLDLGGGSTQITFIPKHNVSHVTLSCPAHISPISFLDY